MVMVASASALQVGSVALLVQVVAELPAVALLLAARANAPTCQLVPFQNLPSLLRCKVKVALLEFRPTPPLLSATLPLKLTGTVAARKELPFAGFVTAAVAGAGRASVKLTAVPLTLLPTVSVDLAWGVKRGSRSAAQVGSDPLLLQFVAALPAVALLVAAKSNAPTCQVAPFQYLLSLLRCKVKVVLLAFRPKPPLLSATLPLKLAGTVAARKTLPPTGVVTLA